MNQSDLRKSLSNQPLNASQIKHSDPDDNEDEEVEVKAPFFSRKSVKAVIIIILILAIIFFGFRTLQQIRLHVRLPSKIENKLNNFEDKIYDYEERIKSRVKDTLAKIPHIHIPGRKDLYDCEECINYDEIIYKSDNVLAVDDYLTKKIDKLADVKLDKRGIISLDSIGKFASRMSRIPQLQEKIQGLLALNRILSRELNETIGIL